MNAVAMIQPGQEIEPASTSPADLLRAAAKVGLNPEQLREMLSVQKDYEANEARKAYVAAMAEFKADPPEIVKKKLVAFGDTSYRHATLFDVTDAIVEALAKHGFSHRWDTGQSEGGIISVTCILTHRLGHSESTTLRSLPDGSGKKNAIQQIASTVTYLQRYTLLAATGLATKDMDDDGRGAGPQDDGTAELFDRLKAAQNKAELVKLKPEVDALTGKARQNMVALYNERNHELKAA